ncbi:beta-ketoacyl-[acyl-carrier-protein] synthase family protein [Ornithinimicrobium humiphilum]|uniref:3-oxoacyl-[acyl-carrier-protein] synthase 2 n=1 Tax=Ornithinimicrobium humiphilum TaxID=125288 RepID=A0A543KPW0_9MICO|nr:beta-ketoacyl-ACP synthase II [Ornithinimicrobium humiphilum]TQM97106.1 3-oxoacyl-[acyl-carrier-protein] synthase II [Ornithinimicrobium humiphilum]
MSASTPQKNRRVVVTGLGATTPVGGSAPDTWEAITAGRSGIRPLTQDWVAEHELPVTFAGSIHTSPAEVLAKVEVRRNDPSGQYALVAAREAWADAGSPEVEPERLGVAIGSGIGGVWTLLDQWEVMKAKGPRRVFPLTVPMLMPNGPAAAVSLDLSARAGAHCPVSACASGAEGMKMALEMIRTGRADVVVCGGTEAAIHPLPIAAFASMTALSNRNDEPERASRPYDVDRDGFVIAEGAGIVVLEAEEHAVARGARIYAELAGAGASSDAYHITAGEPEGAGAARAMQEAVTDGGLSFEDVVHINAHATSTPVGDLAEAKAIRRAFGAHADRIAVSGTKSMTGHLLGAAGALEAVLTVQALHARRAPATINLENKDPEIDLDVVTGSPRELGDGDLAALNNSFGFGGVNVALAFRSWA